MISYTNVNGELVKVNINETLYQAIIETYDWDSKYGYRWKTAKKILTELGVDMKFKRKVKPVIKYILQEYELDKERFIRTPSKSIKTRRSSQYLIPTIKKEENTVLSLQFFAHPLQVVDEECLQYIDAIDNTELVDTRTRLRDGVYHVKSAGIDQNKGFYVICPYCGAIEHHGGKGQVKSNCMPRNNFIID